MKNITILAAILFLVVSCDLFEINFLKDFSKESWKNNPGERYLMRNDLQENYLRVGMTRSEVVELIGEHDSTYYDHHSKCQINVYEMGTGDLTSYALATGFSSDVLKFFCESNTNL